NRILKEERVIVSRFAGTTRDVIEETINIKGVPLRIYDTAGILEPKDWITKKAIEKTSDIFNEADLVILVFDGSRAMDKDDFFLLEKANDKDIVLVINKADLPNCLDLRKLKNVKGPIVKMSALKNNGLKKFEEEIYKMVHKSGIEPDDIIFMNHYQRQILNDVFLEIEETRKFIKDGYTVDFISLSLKECLDDLGKISGEVFSEEILEGIFSSFCIGK
ncbi:MAG: GTP-binding protein, partial [Candidatus Omnitrophica bacterium]|nr:GTP-binding protein [Candidatus Omnitrophota bacterium]